MKIKVTAPFFDNSVLHRVGRVIEWPFDRLPVINPKVAQPADDGDRAAFDRLCLPVDKRPKVAAKPPTDKPPTDKPVES